MCQVDYKLPIYIKLCDAMQKKADELSAVGRCTGETVKLRAFARPQNVLFPAVV